MKKKNNYRNGMVVLTAVLILTGCGSAEVGSKVTREAVSYAEDAMAESAVANQSAAMESYAAETAVMEEAEDVQVEVQDVNRKLIRNVDMTLETEEFDDLLSGVQSRITQLGGYVEQSYIYNNGSYYDGVDFNDLRNADLTVRIPAEKLDEFLSAVSERSNVISQNESVTDVTLQYVDLESHKEALQAEQERLLELMEQAQSIDDIISLESRLSEVRYQIESMESQLRTFDNQVSYSTVYLYIEEVKTYTPTEAPGRLEKMTNGFVESLQGVGNGFLDFCIGFVIALPYLVVWAIIIVLVILVIRFFVKRSKKNQTARMEKRMAEQAARQAAYEALQKQKGTNQNGTV